MNRSPSEVWVLIKRYLRHWPQTKKQIRYWLQTRHPSYHVSNAKVLFWTVVMLAGVASLAYSWPTENYLPPAAVLGIVVFRYFVIQISKIYKRRRGPARKFQPKRRW